MDSLNDLPDVATLTQLRESLYGKTRSRRAAVLVGAGFSRNARLPAADSALPPLWENFARAMAQQLYGDPKATTGNTLRLAEEYGVVFGRAALDDLIRDMVPDEAWQPGEEHDRLLALPWTDVLTTNWDTLLERAAQRSLHTRYGTVRTVGDMAVARAPRIVKLHGSMPSHTPFIFTEEDYRKYPVTHAPYVNLARQVFIENELVLIGFGGEDPNFLQWTGWVRDQLRDQSRRLYLLGVLDLPPSRRRLLESLNVAVVDLHPAVATLAQDLKHSRGTQLLLSFLEAGKPRRPSDWPYVETPHGLEKVTLEHSQAVLHTWALDRSDYPGWFICPAPIRSQIRARTDFPLARFRSVYESQPLERLLDLVRESAWRCRLVGLSPPQWLAEKMEAVLANDALSAKLDASGKLDVAVILAEAARIAGDDALLERRLALFGRTHDSANWVAFMRALRRRDTLQVAALEEVLEEIDGDDPVWTLRRAGLTASAGRIGEARGLYRSALVQLRQRMLSDPESIWVRSRLAWAELFARVSQGFVDRRESDPLARISRDEPTMYERDIDPWGEIEYLRRELYEAELSNVESRGRTEPNFDSGIYTQEPARRDTPNAVSPPVSTSVQFVLDAFGSSGDFGNVSFCAEESRRAAALANLALQGSHDRATSVCVTAKNSRLLSQLYRRAVVATMPFARVNALTQRLLDLAHLALDRCDVAVTAKGDGAFEEHQFWIGRLNTAMESLSRLSMRATCGATALHRTVLQWARRPALTHWWTHERYSSLVQRTWEAVPIEERPGFALEHLTFPLATEGSKVDDMGYWPNPMDPATRYTRSTDAGAWDRRFSELVELAKGSTKSRSHALVRLVPLSRSEISSVEEKSAVGQALWARLQSNGLPADTGLHDFVVYEVPAPPGKDAGALFWTAYLQSDDALHVNETWLLNVAGGCAQAKRRGVPGPSAGTARQWCESVMRWRPPSSADHFGWASIDTSSPQIATFLQHAVFPYLERSNFDDALWTAYTGLVDAVPRALAACPYFALRCPEFAAKALSAVRRNLWHGDRSRSLPAALAVSRWLEDATELAWQPLVDDLVALCAIPRHPTAPLLWRALALAVRNGCVPESSEDRILQALEALDSHADYSAWDGVDVRWEEQAPLVIVEAIHIASELQRRGRNDPQLTRWIDRALADPLPEVRAVRLAG